MTTTPDVPTFADPRVRALGPDDATAFSVFAERVFRETYAEEYTPADIDAYATETFGPDRQRAEIAERGARVLVIEDERNGLLGFAHLRHTPVPDALAGRFALEIARFYIDRPWHGTGLARVLMSACIAEARSRGADALWLLVYQRNPRAIAFYEKSGFRRAGTQPFRLGQRVDDDWVMVRTVVP